jgi:hypothetical protein
MSLAGRHPARFSVLVFHRRAQNGVWEVSRYDRRPGNMVAEDLDVLVVVLRSPIDVADSTATQKNVRALMNGGEETIVRISAVPSCGLPKIPYQNPVSPFDSVSGE